MEFLKKKLLTITLGLLAVGFVSTDLYAQDRTAAVEAYNNARNSAEQGNYEQAISQYNQALANAVALGEEGQDIVDRIEDALPKVHMQQSIALYRQNQSPGSLAVYDELISSFGETASVAEEFGNSQIQAQAEGVVTQMYYNKAVFQFSNGSYQQALENLNTALERNPNYAKAYYQKALTIKNLEGSTEEEIMAAFDEAISVAQQEGDNTVLENASNSTANYLFQRGATLARDENYAQAMPLLTRALEYAPNHSDAYYWLSVSHNKRGEFQDGLNDARQSLEHETGGAADQAKIYYEIGVAYKGMGEVQQACDAFRNALYGDFTESARNQIEEQLKCEDASDAQQ